MHYPHRPQRGEPIKASDIRNLADAAEAARFLPGQQFVASQSIRGIRVTGNPPTLLTIVQCIEDSHIAAGGGDGSSWAVTRAREMFLHQLTLYPRKPQRLLTIWTPTSRVAGDVLLAWWDSTSGAWIGISNNEGSDAEAHVMITSNIPDDDGYYPGEVQRYDVATKTWQTLYTCKVVDVNQ
jgi:hypothetical protein